MTRNTGVLPPRGWATLYPRRRGDWTLAGPRETWARFNPETYEWHALDPQEDPSLPAIGPATTAGRLVGYRFGRRAIIQTTDRYIKVVRPRRLDQLVRNHEYLTNQLTQFATPRVVESHPDGAVHISKLSGNTMHQLICQNSLTPKAIEKVAEALAAFHLLTPPQELAPRTADERSHWLETVGRAEPDLAEILATAASRLPPLPDDDSSLIHGDLHDKNIIIDNDEHRVGLIDLDGLALGAREDDLANLCVHTELRVLQTKQAAADSIDTATRLRHASNALTPLNAERFDAATRHTWFRLACIYRYRRTYRHLFEELLHRSNP